MVRSFSDLICVRMIDQGSGVRRLNPHDRARRNASVVAARCAGHSWASIECRFGVSARQARRIVKDLGTAMLTPSATTDAVEIVERAIMRHEAMIEQL